MLCGVPGCGAGVGKERQGPGGGQNAHARAKAMSSKARKWVNRSVKCRQKRRYGGAGSLKYKISHKNNSEIIQLQKKMCNFVAQKAEGRVKAAAFGSDRTARPFSTYLI